ncbi:hypothetical protein LCGC14_1775660 [marine sediment metagenome]|uniref:Uncharacterized protein n=1 Tax=marine sediment metagenome TaxID=412755 RepID=A0A0F9JWP7_9ZZZZ
MKEPDVQVFVYNQDSQTLESVRARLEATGMDVQLVNITGVVEDHAAVVKSACAEIPVGSMDDVIRAAESAACIVSKEK